MKNITKHKGKIRLIERLENSKYGNPQFILGVIDDPIRGLGWTFKTPKNYIDKDIEVTVTLGTHYNTCTLNSIEKH